MFSCPIIRFTGVLYEWFTKYEKWIFLLFLLVTLLQLWLTRYIPSLDGPQHLYNANVLAELLKGNELMRSFYDINEVVVGYWSGHFFLTFFKLFFPAWLAEKLFLTTYVLAMVFSFRYLVRVVNPMKGNFVVFLIFPFVYHSYFLLGYYSFSIAAIFFFLAFGYWIRNQDRMTLRRIVVFGLLVLGVFLSHGLVFVFFGISFILFFLSTIIYSLLSNRAEFSVSTVLRKVLKATLAVLPSLILWIIYIRSVMTINGEIIDASYTFKELVVFILRIRQLVGFDHGWEMGGYIPLFVLIMLLSGVFLVSFIGAIKDKSESFSTLFSSKNFWIFVAITFLGLYFFLPDKISAGNLTNRFGLFFFFSIITWLSMQKFPKTFQVISLLIVLFSISYSRIIHHHYYKQLNWDVAELEELKDYVEPNSIMTYQLASDKWLDIHFQLYVAADNPIVHLKNPQCQGQFPVVWNLEELPRCFAGNKEVRPSGSHRLDSVEYPSMDIDYVTVFRNDEYWKDSTNAEWHSILKTHFEERYVSSKGNASLWERK